jgi:hypothetical protein
MADIIYGDRVEDDFERVCSMLVGPSCEAVEAFWAFEELESLESRLTLAFLDCVFAPAMRASWIGLLHGEDLSN